MPQQHGNKLKIQVLLTKQQYERLKKRAERELRSVSEMAAVAIDKATKEE